MMYSQNHAMSMRGDQTAAGEVIGTRGEKRAMTAVGELARAPDSAGAKTELPHWSCERRHEGGQAAAVRSGAPSPM